MSQTEKTLCVDCKQHWSSVNFAESTLDAIHGFSCLLCKCCYFKRVEKTYEIVKQNYEKLGLELREEGCR